MLFIFSVTLVTSEKKGGKSRFDNCAFATQSSKERKGEYIVN